MAFSIAIKHERARRALTQEQVSTRGDINITYLRDLEYGRCNPSIEKLFGIAKGLGIKPSTLIEYTEEILAQSESDK